MSTLYVTIGGKEIYSAGGTATPAAARQPSSSHASAQACPAARILGLVAAVGLLVLLAVWLSQRRRHS